jgi:hypothetical protein
VGAAAVSPDEARNVIVTARALMERDERLIQQEEMHKRSLDRAIQSLRDWRKTIDERIETLTALQALREKIDAALAREDDVLETGRP